MLTLHKMLNILHAKASVGDPGIWGQPSNIDHQIISYLHTPSTGMV